MKFSERMGHKPVSHTLQVESMSDDLRNSLWNFLDRFIWAKKNFKDVSNTASKSNIHKFSQNLWMDYFKKPMDEIPYDYPGLILQQIRDYFFEAPWYEVYDFLEYILLTEANALQLTAVVNYILKSELAGYRFIESAFVPITDEVEVESVQNALTEVPFNGVHAHLKQAMEHLSRKENPDYRNSIKESISAVEGMVKEITGNPNDSLGKALNKIDLHPSLRKGFSSIYGYTSNADGIRHAMLDEPNITVADAKFLLVSCSTFINYLKTFIPSS